jgi:uncharacterized protein (TIGR00251 family)
MMLTVLKVRITPGAQRDCVLGEIGGEVRIKLRAPAVDGKANAALIEFLSMLLTLPRSKIQVKTGLTSRVKLIWISGLDPVETRRRLELASL